jgi:hypothetical protein
MEVYQQTYEKKIKELSMKKVINMGKMLKL